LRHDAACELARWLELELWDESMDAASSEGVNAATMQNEDDGDWAAEEDPEGAFPPRTDRGSRDWAQLEAVAADAYRASLMARQTILRAPAPNNWPAALAVRALSAVQVEEDIAYLAELAIELVPTTVVLCGE
jgi:hypothetical protein